MTRLETRVVLAFLAALIAGVVLQEWQETRAITEATRNLTNTGKPPAPAQAPQPSQGQTQH